MKSSSKRNPKVRLARVVVLAAVLMTLLSGLSAATSHYTAANHPALLGLIGGSALQCGGVPTLSDVDQHRDYTSLASAPITIASVMWGSLVKREEPKDPRVRGRARGWPSGRLTQATSLGAETK